MVVVVAAIVEKIQGAAALWWCIDRTTESTMNRVWKWRAEAGSRGRGKTSIVVPYITKRMIVLPWIIDYED